MNEQIIAVDGEAIDGEYRLLGSSSYDQPALQGRLTTKQCLDFLIDQGARCNRLYGYGIGYDVAHWVKDLSHTQKKLLADTGMAYTEQGLKFYRVVYRPNCYFRVDRLRGVPTNSSGREVVATAMVVDLMRWHRKPYADVCDEWQLGDENDRIVIRSVKEQRSGFSEIHGRLVERYNRIECNTLAELAGEMERELKLLKLPLSLPLTCGAIAGKLASSRYRIQSFHGGIPEKVLPAVKGAFHGGRMQVCRFGKFENVNHYDIRSAYGWALTQLPDMLGTWEPCNKIRDGWGIYKVSWDIPEGTYPVMPFPSRDSKGYIHYPPRGTGWYWSPLVRSVRRNFPSGMVNILEGWHYTPLDKTSRPFWYVEELYGMRRALKEIGDPTAGMIKLIIVATWGRLCSDGSRHRHGKGWRKPSVSQGKLDWAGMATSLIHEKMLDAIMENPNEFISCCVDGFWTTSNWPHKIGDSLGDWTGETAEELFLIRPSFYWARMGTEWECKTSGISGGLEALDRFREEWDAHGWRGAVGVTQRACNGLLQCSGIGDFSRLGEFSDNPVVVKLNPGFVKCGHICPTSMSGNREWERWLPYWPPVSSVDTESANFQSRTEREIPEEIVGMAIDEVSEG